MAAKTVAHLKDGNRDFNNILDSYLNLTDGGTVSKATTFSKGFQASSQAITATADGLTTGIIPTGATFVTVTSAGANNIILLPPPTPGTIVYIFVGANGCELRVGTSAGADGSGTISIGGNTASSAHESALPANSLTCCICTSATTWVGFEVAANNAITALEVAAS